MTREIRSPLLRVCYVPITLVPGGHFKEILNVGRKRTWGRGLKADDTPSMGDLGKTCWSLGPFRTSTGLGHLEAASEEGKCEFWFSAGNVKGGKENILAGAPTLGQVCRPRAGLAVGEWRVAALPQLFAIIPQPPLTGSGSGLLSPALRF